MIAYCRQAVYNEDNAQMSRTLTPAPLLRRTFLASMATPMLWADSAIAPDADGTLLVGGKRRFVLGLYDLPKVPEPWQEARAAGFDLVHVRASADDFAHARKAGLRTWLSLGSIKEKAVTRTRSEFDGPWRR